MLQRGWRTVRWQGDLIRWNRLGRRCLNGVQKKTFSPYLLLVGTSLRAQLVKNPPPMQRPQFDPWVGKIHWRRDKLPTPVFLGFPCGSTSKESACNAGDLGSIPGLGRSAGEGKGSPLQYSGLKNSMDSIVLGVAKNQMCLSDFHFLLVEESHRVSCVMSNLNVEDSLPRQGWALPTHRPSCPFRDGNAEIRFNTRSQTRGLFGSGEVMGPGADSSESEKYPPPRSRP